MSTPSTAERRCRIERLLAEAASRKVQYAGTKIALEFVQKARALAVGPPRLEPWASLTAYRLAHLLLRGACDAPALRAIDALFDEASRCSALAPYPQVYRLAVLHRLETPRAELERAFGAAVRAYDEHVRARAAHAGFGEEELAPPSAPIQTDLFALLDLAGHFLAVEGRPHAGRGARPELLLGGDAHWRVVGPDRALADVLVSEEIALAELASLAPELGAAFTFVLPPARDRAHLRTADGRTARLPHRAARLLACLLRGHARDVHELVHRVVGSDGARALTTFRQVKRRLRADLAALGVDAPDDLVQQTPGAPLSLAPGLVVLGAVSESGYADVEG